MQRIDNSGAVASLPAAQPAGTPGYFGRGNPGLGLLATPLSADWANMVQEELMGIVLAAGITPSKTDLAQVLAALRSTGVFTTPAQFDSSTKAATMAALQRALGNMRGQFPFNASQALSAAQAGGLVAFYGATAGQTLTLPLAASLTGGAGYWIANVASVAVSVAPSGADTITRNLVVGGSSTAAPLVLNPGDCIFFGSAGAGSWGTFGITQAALLASDKGTTAPQFDATQKLATMEALQRALGNYRAVEITGGARTLTAADSGRLFSANAGSSFALPLFATVPSGATFTIFNASGSPVTVSRQGADLIFGPDGVVYGLGSALTSITIESGGWAVISAAAQWEVIGGSVLNKVSADFAATRANPGGFRLPNGIIFKIADVSQAVAANTDTNWTLTFGSAFPNACLDAFAIAGNYVQSTRTVESFNAGSVSGVCRNPTAQTLLTRVIAIGW